MQLADLVARESIRDLVARYNSYGDSGRIDQMLDLFAPDAVLDIDGELHEGVDAIRSVFTGTVERTAGAEAGPAYLRHGTSTHQIDLVDDTHATGRCYFFVLTTVGLDHWGRYVDRYVVIDGAWRFASRRVLVDDFGPGSLFRSNGGDGTRPTGLR